MTFRPPDYDLLEFDRYIQAPNDAYALKIRFSILNEENLRQIMERNRR